MIRKYLNIPIINYYINNTIHLIHYFLYYKIQYTLLNILRNKKIYIIQTHIQYQSPFN